MATDYLRFCADPCRVEPAGRRADLAQPPRARALRPARRTAATPAHLGHAALRPAQTGAVADRAGVCAGGRHLLLGNLRDRILRAGRPASPSRVVYPAAPGVPALVVDRQFCRLWRSLG